MIIRDADLELDPNEYLQLIEPIIADQPDVVCGSRFLEKSSAILLRTRVANRLLTLLTNLLFGAHLSDMETAHKAFGREAVAGLDLRCVRFDFEPEITARLMLAGYRIHEVPIRYNPRTKEQGKTIAWLDGIEAIYALLRCRFT